MVAQIDQTYKRFGWTKVLRRLVCYLLEGRPLTTRGRALNPLTRFFLQQCSRPFAGAAVDRPVFILGMGRSGTTFLGNAMSVHPAVAYFNEPKLMWSLAFPQDDLVGNYVLGPARYRMDEGGVTEQGARAIRAMYALCCACTRSPRIVDKYPEMIFRLPFLAQIFPDARFVAIVRSGHNVIRSVASWNRRNAIELDGSRENWWGLDDRKWHFLCDQLLPGHPDFAAHVDTLRAITDDTQRSAIEWILTMEEIAARQAQWGDKLFVIRYEDLMNDTAVSVDNLTAFCGLRQDRSILEYVEAAKDFSPEVASCELPDFIQAPFDRMIRHFGYR